MAKRKEHAWRRVSRERNGSLKAYSIGQGRFDIYASYTVTYRQNVTGFTRKEDERGVGLQAMLRDMKMSDKDYGLLTMLESGLETLNKLFDQWDWRRRREEEVRKEKMKKEKLARKRIKRVKDRRFGRVLEI